MRSLPDPRLRPPSRRAPSDPAMPVVAAAATMIAALALIAAVVSWRALAGHAHAAGGEAIGAALAPARGTLVVDSLRDGGVAMRAGLRVGDVVEAVDGAAAVDPARADRALARPEVDLRVRRGDRSFVVHLALNERGPRG